MRMAPPHFTPSKSRKFGWLRLYTVGGLLLLVLVGFAVELWGGLSLTTTVEPPAMLIVESEDDGRIGALHVAESSSHKISDLSVAITNTERWDRPPADLFAPGEELLIVCFGDSITFGNGSHDTRRQRPRRPDGNYPLRLRHLVTSRPSSLRPASLIVYNYGVGGRTSSHRHSDSHAKTPEYAAAKALLRDALEYNADANGLLAPAHSFASLSGRRYQAGALVGSPAGTAARRTVLLVVKMGTNDSKDPVWRTLSGDGRTLLSGSNASSAFAAEYLRMVRGLVPDGGVAEGTSINVARRIRFVVVFVSPIPSLPDPRKNKKMLGGIRGLRIATDIRAGVHLAAQEASRNHSLALPGLPVEASVHFFDLFAPFMDYVASLEGDAPVKPSELAWLRCAFPLSGAGAFSSMSIEDGAKSFMKRMAADSLLGKRRIGQALSDGVHPTVEGHEHMAHLLYKWLAVN